VRDDAGDHFHGHEADDQGKGDRQVARVGVRLDGVGMIVPVIVVMAGVVVGVRVRHGISQVPIIAREGGDAAIGRRPDAIRPGDRPASVLGALLNA
jgi:hypothetical protein